MATYEQAATVGDPPARPGVPTGWYPWYVSAVLSLAYMFGQIDRMVLNLLVEPIRADLGISDTQISLLQGFAFSIAIAIGGIPIAWLADRFSRRNIAGIGIVFWSLMTMLCGLASSFSHLFLARVGLGIGESSLTPASYSMLADYFSREKLAKAIGINMVGGTVGVGLAMILGGIVVAALTNMGPVDLPIVGIMKPWQLAFPIAGLPALVIGIWVLTLREPPRGASAKAKSATPDRSGNVLRFILANKGTMIALFLGFPLLILTSSALTSWFPTFLIREYGWTLKQTGVGFGIVMLVFGTAGALASGWIVEALHKRGHPDACLRASVFAAIGLAICGSLAPLAPSRRARPSPHRTVR